MRTSSEVDNSLLMVQPPRSNQGFHLNKEIRFRVNIIFWKRGRAGVVFTHHFSFWDAIEVPLFPVTWRGHQTAPCLSSSPGSIRTRPGPASAVRVFCFEAAPSETPRWLLASSSMQVTVSFVPLSFLLHPLLQIHLLIRGNSHQFQGAESQKRSISQLSKLRLESQLLIQLSRDIIRVQVTVTQLNKTGREIPDHSPQMVLQH